MTYRRQDYQWPNWYSLNLAKRRIHILRQRLRIAQREGNMAIIRYCLRELGM